MMEHDAMPIDARDPDALAQRLRQLVRQERHVQTDFLLCLAEFDRGRGYERMGYASLWDFCRKELGLLECACYRRTHAVRLLQRFPQAEALLRDGRLWMTTFVMLEKLLNLPDANADELFAQASGKSKKEVEYLVACRLPATVEPPTHVRKLPVPRSAALPAVLLVGGNPEQTMPLVTIVESATQPFCESVPVVTLTTAPTAVAPNRPSKLEPIAEDRFVIQVTVNKAFVDLLGEAKIALSHRVPGGDLEGVLRAALEDVVARDVKRNAPAGKGVHRGAPSPQPPPSGRGGRTKRSAIPAVVRREVWQRDGGCCVWRNARGVCGSRWQLELDHVVPCARGGKSTVANLRLLCSEHNAQHARESFGEEHMRRARSRPTSPGRSPA